ncbi:MAG: TetR family transcriptional regulator [Actinobacteria bacterium]|nr:TetR family transcriptional regulator [Actinomycetota bacterium]
MPKLGMEPIRREQICRAAATVIAREGFAATTLRNVADEAGVSTGMLNHYFSNRQDLLTQTLVFVSERTQRRLTEVIESMPPGWPRVEALLDHSLADEDLPNETWRVWINAYGEAVHLPKLRKTIEERLLSWYDVLDLALEGLDDPDPDGIPWSWRFDAILNGLAIQALTSEASLDMKTIRNEVVKALRGYATADV